MASALLVEGRLPSPASEGFRRAPAWWLASLPSLSLGKGLEWLVFERSVVDRESARSPGGVCGIPAKEVALAPAGLRQSAEPEELLASPDCLEVTSTSSEPPLAHAVSKCLFAPLLGEGGEDPPDSVGLARLAPQPAVGSSEKTSSKCGTMPKLCGLEPRGLEPGLADGELLSG